MDNKFNPPMQWHSGEHATSAMKEPHGTLLDHFAGLAMQGLIVASVSGYEVSELSKLSYLTAKAMLEARQEITGNIHENN